MEPAATGLVIEAMGQNITYQEQRESPPPLAGHGEKHGNSYAEIVPESSISNKREGRLLRYGRVADYRTEHSNVLRGNPLIEAMKPILSEEDAYPVLAHLPIERDRDFLKQPLELRLEGLHDLRDVYIPTPEFVEAFGLIMRAIRRSYRYRDPRDPRVMRFLYELAEMEEPALLPRLSPTGGGSNGILLVGTTGVGKTSFVDRLVQYVSPQAIIHVTLGGRPCYWPQVVVFRIQAAETKTVAGIASAIAAQADALTGSRHKAQLRGKTNRGEVLVICCQILCSLMAGILIVEDLQLLKSTGGSATEILDFLANIMETTGIPVASVSTFRVKHVVKANTAVGSKLTAGGTREFFPVPLGDDFTHLIQTYWSLRVTTGGKTMPEWLPELAHHLTAGVRRFVREFFEYLFERMAIEEVNNPNKTFVRTCAAQSIGRYKRAISCLQRVREKEYVAEEEYLLYEDLFDRPSPKFSEPKISTGDNSGSQRVDSFTDESSNQLAEIFGIPVQYDEPEPKKRAKKGNKKQKHKASDESALDNDGGFILDKLSGGT